jgi:hypothetical protein
MDIWYPAVLGTVIFFYITFFNRNAKMYLDSGKTMSWSEFIEKTFSLNQWFQ